MADNDSNSENSDELLDNNDTWSNVGDWREDEAAIAVCPFCLKNSFTSSECFIHTKNAHAFDFHAIKLALKLDFYGCMRLVNYVRSNNTSSQEAVITQSELWLDNDKYLMPVLEDDPLLFAFEEEDDSEEQQQEADEVSQLKYQLQLAHEKYSDLLDHFSAYREQVDSRKPTIDKPNSNSIFQDKNDYYFESYANNDIHESMLKDTVRTEAYRDFMYDNKGYFKDKIVLDIGCGSGVLSMFAAKAGAKHVYAVDNSMVIERAKINVLENNLNHQITYFQADIVLLREM
jgi:protein arginine N-methyltransferase 3